MKRHRHRAFYIAVLIGLAVAAATFWTIPEWGVSISAIAFCGSYLGLSLARLPALSVDYLRANAGDDDAPVAAIFGITALIVGLCVVSLFRLVRAGEHDLLQLALAVVAVVLAWFVVHTLATYHYAYEFYEKQADGSEGRGLEFPGREEPDGLSFLYFSYVIGMTAQVADVDISTNAMRRVVLIHSVFAFFFNTIIVASMVNVAVSVGGG